MTSVGVNCYVVHPDGDMELLLGADTDYFGGACPMVGDVITAFGEPRHFRITARQFLTAKDRDRGWALTCEEDFSPHSTMVAITWMSDSAWMDEVDFKVIEERARDARRELKAKKKTGWKPQSP